MTSLLPNKGWKLAKGHLSIAPGEALRAVQQKAKTLLTGLEEDLEAAESGSQVHGARRRIKRLRSLSRLVRPAIGQDIYRETNDHLKAAADALAGARRAEALTLAADQLAEKLPAARPLHQIVVDHHAVRAQETPPASALKMARQAMADAAAAIDAWHLTTQAGSSILVAFADTYRKARKRLRAAVTNGEAKELHEARKLVIHHLHHLELLSDLLPADPSDRIKALNELREALGNFNDLAELEELAREHEDALPRKVIKSIAKRQTKLLERARKAWEPLFGQKSKAFLKRIGSM